jgi:hypothetical protein
MSPGDGGCSSREDHRSWFKHHGAPLLGRERATLLQTLVVLWPDAAVLLRSCIEPRKDVAMPLPWLLVLRVRLAALPGQVVVRGAPLVVLGPGLAMLLPCLPGLPG